MSKTSLKVDDKVTFIVGEETLTYFVSEHYDRYYLSRGCNNQKIFILLGCEKTRHEWAKKLVGYDYCDEQGTTSGFPEVYSLEALSKLTDELQSLCDAHNDASRSSRVDEIDQQADKLSMTFKGLTLTSNSQITFKVGEHEEHTYDVRKSDGGWWLYNHDYANYAIFDFLGIEDRYEWVDERITDKNNGGDFPEIPSADDFVKVVYELASMCDRVTIDGKVFSAKGFHPMKIRSGSRVHINLL